LDSSKTRLVNLCRKTGRSHWILREFRFSRMTFKEMADRGFLNGVRRSSW
jgi:small subunit ribosomal protein S14